MGDVVHILNMTQPGVSRSVKSLEKKKNWAMSYFTAIKISFIPTPYI